MAGRPDSYMPIFIADYLGDTRHLSLSEHGAYLLLIFQYWKSGRPLPDENAILARLCSVSVTDWDTVSVAVREFFHPAIINGKKVLTHKRVEQELEKARSNYDKRVAASARANQAKSDAAARVKAKSETVTDTDTVADTDTVTDTVSVTQLRTQNSDYKSLDQSSAPPSAAPLSKPPEPVPEPSQTKGRRWSPDEAIPPNWIFEAEKARADHGLPAVDLALEADKFANYWASKTGRGATHADWKRTWINWALNAKETTNGRRISAHDKGTLGAAMFLAEHDAARNGDGTGASGDPLSPRGHGRSEVENPVRNVLGRLPPPEPGSDA